MVKHFLLVATMLLVATSPALRADPTSLCQQHPTLACVTAFLQNINCCGGNYLDGIEEIGVNVTNPSPGGSPAFYTTNKSPDPGYITILAAPSTGVFIVPSMPGNSSNVGRCPHLVWDDEWHPNTASLNNLVAYQTHGPYTPVFQAVCEW